jgi:hypothetical protein
MLSKRKSGSDSPEAFAPATSPGADPVLGRELTPGVGEAVKGANYDYRLQLVRHGATWWPRPL